MTGDFDVKKFIAAFVVALMLICEVFIGLRAFQDIKAADEIAVQTEVEGGQEAESLKTEYTDKANKQLWLAVIFGILFANMGAVLAEWSRT